MRRECREFFPDTDFKGNRWLAMAGKRFQAFPVHAQPAIERIWHEARDHMIRI